MVSGLWLRISTITWVVLTATSPLLGTVDWGTVVERIRASGYGKPLNLEDTYVVGVSEGSVREFLSVSRSAAERLLGMSTI